MENVGLVLEGGGMRGAFTAGVLDFLMEKNVWLSDVYGVSAGACQGCNYLSGQIGRGLRIWTDYVDDKRYCSLQSLVRTGDLFGADMSYNLVPNLYDPFDYDAYIQKGGRFIAVVTNVETGKAEYLRVEDMRRDLHMIRASSALPLVSNIVEINGRRYMDGGIADSIPLKRSIQDGHRRNVLVLTQAAGYRKSPNRAQPVIALKYRRYPEFVKTSARRHLQYNAALDLVTEEVKAGRCFVIQPDEPPDIGRVERNVGKLRALHARGYAVAARRYDELMTFLDGGQTPQAGG